MKKGKKIVAFTMSTAMAFTCFTACDEKTNNGKKADITPIPVPTLEPMEGIIEPEMVENDADAKKISLTVWAPSEEQELMKDLCEKFDGANSQYDITFNYEICSESEAATNFSADPEKSADVFMFSGDQLSNMANSKLLYNLSALVKDYPEIETQYDEQAYNSCKIDGNLYAFPFTANQYFMYYNKSMFTEEEVKSLDDILAKDLGKAKSGENIKNFGFSITDAWYLLSFMYGNDCTLYGDGTQAKECNWNSKEGVAVVKYLNSVMKTGKFYNNADDEGMTLLGKGELATIVTGSWNSNAVKDKLGDNYAATVLPTFTIDGKECHMKPFADFKMLGVNAFTKTPKESAELAYFLANTYSQWMRLKVRAYAPTIKSLQEYVTDDTVEKDAEIDAAVIAATEQMKEENSSLRPTTPQLKNYWQFGANLGSLIYKQDERITDESKIQDTLDKVVQGITTEM